MKIAILIPTIYRPEGLLTVLSSFYKSISGTIEHDIHVFVAGETDDEEAKKIARQYWATYCICEEPLQGPGYAYNTALKHAKDYDAYFLASDDCEFTLGWLEEVLSVLYLELDGSGLVGINDGRKDSRRIKLGEIQPTHYLMTKDFIIKYNGGIAAYPYPVDFTDLEACVKARAANKFAYAENAIVKHNWIGINKPDEHFKRNQLRKKEAKLLYAERLVLGFPNNVEAILK